MKRTKKEDGTDTEKAEQFFHSKSLNQWTRNQSQEKVSASFPRSAARTSEDLTATPPNIMDSKGIYGGQRKKLVTNDAGAPNPALQAKPNADVFNIKEMFSA